MMKRFSATSELDTVSPPVAHSGPMFEFQALLPELQGALLQTGPLTTQICLSLTCKALYANPSRRKISFPTFVTAICAEGAIDILNFALDELNTNTPTKKDLSGAAKNGHFELIGKYLDRFMTHIGKLNDQWKRVVEQHFCSSEPAKSLVNKIKDFAGHESDLRFYEILGFVDNSLSDRLAAIQNELPTIISSKHEPLLHLAKKALQKANIDTISIFLKHTSQDELKEIPILEAAAKNPRPEVLLHIYNLYQPHYFIELDVAIMASIQYDRFENYIFLLNQMKSLGFERNLKSDVVHALSTRSRAVLGYLRSFVSFEFAPDILSSLYRSNGSPGHSVSQAESFRLFRSLGLPIPKEDYQSFLESSRKNPGDDVHFLAEFMMDRDWNLDEDGILEFLYKISADYDCEQKIRFVLSRGAPAVSGLINEALVNNRRRSYFDYLVSAQCPIPDDAYVNVISGSMPEEEKLIMIRTFIEMRIAPSDESLKHLLTCSRLKHDELVELYDLRNPNIPIRNPDDSVMFLISNLKESENIPLLGRRLAFFIHRLPNGAKSLSSDLYWRIATFSFGKSVFDQIISKTPPVRTNGQRHLQLLEFLNDIGVPHPSDPKAFWLQLVRALPQNGSQYLKRGGMFIVYFYLFDNFAPIERSDLHDIFHEVITQYKFMLPHVNADFVAAFLDQKVMNLEITAEERVLYRSKVSKDLPNDEPNPPDGVEYEPIGMTSDDDGEDEGEDGGEDDDNRDAEAVAH